MLCQPVPKTSARCIYHPVMQVPQCVELIDGLSFSPQIKKGPDMNEALHFCSFCREINMPELLKLILQVYFILRSIDHVTHMSPTTYHTVDQQC